MFEIGQEVEVEYDGNTCRGTIIGIGVNKTAHFVKIVRAESPTGKSIAFKTYTADEIKAISA